MSPLQEAVKMKDLSRVRALLTASPSSIDEVLGERKIPMALYAAEVSSFEILRYIVEYSRASLDIYDSLHQNILHYAARSGDLDKCVYLTERCGMDPVCGYKDLLTPYETAWKKASSSPAHRTLCAYYEKKIGAPMEDLYRNPIRTGFFPDPSVVAVGDDFYMVNLST